MKSKKTTQKIKKSKSILLKTIIIIISIIIIFLICFFLYVNDYYHADIEAIETFETTSEINKNVLQDNTIIYSNNNSKVGLIFYPGGKVEYNSYEPLMKSLASQDILCVLIEMPFNLAVFDINAADDIQELYPNIKSWYIAGHSLGGAMAASYLEQNTKNFDGLILLGAYSTANLSKTNLNVISIYGSEDKILNYNNYEKNKMNLPKDFKEYIIDGGCHSYFGMYGLQKGDGIPSITNQEQIDKTTNVITSNIFK